MVFTGRLGHSPHGATMSDECYRLPGARVHISASEVVRRHPPPMTEDDAETDAIVAQLEAAGRIEIYVNEGRAYRSQRRVSQR
jgi:hypothetical protein